MLTTRYVDEDISSPDDTNTREVDLFDMYTTVETVIIQPGQLKKLSREAALNLLS